MNKLAELYWKPLIFTYSEIIETIYSGIISIVKQYNFSKMSVVGGEIASLIAEASVFEKTSVPIVLNGFVNYLGNIKFKDLPPIMVWYDPYQPNLQLIISQGDDYIIANIVEE